MGQRQSAAGSDAPGEDAEQQQSSASRGGGSGGSSCRGSCGGPAKPDPAKDTIVVIDPSGTSNPQFEEVVEGDEGDEAPKEREQQQQIGGSSSSSSGPAASEAVASERVTAAVLTRRAAGRPKARLGLFCGSGGLPGPDVELDHIGPRTVTVSWNHTGQAANKFYICVVLLPAEKKGASSEAASGSKGGSSSSRSPPTQPQDIVCFEVSGDRESVQLPAGTLERAHGPYRVDIVAEGGPESSTWLTGPGISVPFSTPPEPASAVRQLALLQKPSEHEIRVGWEPPSDDGGSAIAEYEVALRQPGDGVGDDVADPGLPAACAAAAKKLLDDEDDSDASPVNRRIPSEDRRSWTTLSCEHTFAALPPNTSYRIEVRARTAAGVIGRALSLKASTALAAPTAPEQLHAQLLPRWSENGDVRLPPTGALGETGDDVDIVRLEFRAPVSDGGRQIETFTIYAEQMGGQPDNGPEPRASGRERSVHQALFAEDAKPLCRAPAGDAVFAASGDSERSLRPGCPCRCDVAVRPNRSYVFSVEASNGTYSSGRCEPSQSFFVPPRVPPPPREPPEAFRDEGGFAAQLQWVSPLRSGGLPVTFFKIGIIGPSPVPTAACASATAAAAAAEPVLQTSSDSAALAMAGRVQREVTVSASNAVIANCGESVEDRSSGQALCTARVDGLEADASYRFILAAGNAAGTGPWSRPSAPVWTPMAAPVAPANAVATVGLNANQEVMVTLGWECKHGRAGSGKLAFFNVVLVPAYSPSSDTPVVRERIRVGSVTEGQRMTWSSPLSAPGKYQVEVSSENSANQRSPPTVLEFEAQPEMFPPKVPEKLPKEPVWAAKPYLVLGSSAEKQPPACFRGFDWEVDTWLQLLLLWDAESIDMALNLKGAPVSGPAHVDVLCNFRLSSTDQARCVTLGEDVTSSRLHATLPTGIAMSLRLFLRQDEEASGPKKPALLSAPMALLLSDEGTRMKPTWEVWSRQSPDGLPPRWVDLPSMLQDSIESAWLEGKRSFTFDLPCLHSGDQDEEDSLADVLANGHYELMFGDERQVQHSVNKRSGPAWSANARRTVRDPQDGDAHPGSSSLATEDLCVICMEHRRTFAFMHADTGDGHLAVCGACAEPFKSAGSAGGSRALRSCPMCRRPFSAIQRIYQ